MPKNLVRAVRVSKRIQTKFLIKAKLSRGFTKKTLRIEGFFRIQNLDPHFFIKKYMKKWVESDL